MTQAIPMLSLKGVKKKFGNKIVLDGVDIEINKGSSLVIIGGSGTGKSVTLKSVLGLVTPDEGSIKVDGQEVIDLGARARQKMLSRFGMLFQGGALFDSLKVWENIAFSLIQGKKMDRSKAYKIAIEKLNDVGLDSSVADLFPAELSGGMQKRVGLARAIAADPEIIFFDEPTTGLDPIMGDIINDLIVKCVKELGATAMSITHDMHSARKIGDHIAMLHEGKIIWHGTPKEMDETDNPYVDQFIHGRAEGPLTKSLIKI